jgi:hypothetical protein
MPIGPRKRFYGLVARYLTRPRKAYRQVVPNDMESLKHTIRKGDVLLVDGDQRVSEVIKYLTQSSWSHAALYIGDELVRRNPQNRALLSEQYGEDANHLVAEALMEGVVTSPLGKYTNFNIRVCRPYNLRKEDLQRILDEVLGQLGFRYDVQNLLDLARYFFPVSLIPRRFRRKALQLGSGLTHEAICSSLIARAFDHVGYPILPHITRVDAPRPTLFGRARNLVFRRRPLHGGIFRQPHPTLVTPRDFDLSPYFEIIKFNRLANARFDYRRIQWADGGEKAAG